MNSLRVIRHEFHFERLAFQRNPMAVFSTVGLPLLYMIIFVSLFGNELLGSGIYGQPGPLLVGSVMTANFIAIGIISAAFFNLAVKLIEARENGVLKRYRATPLPTWSFIGGHVGTSIFLSIALTVFLATLARVVYGIPIPMNALPAFVLAVIVGAISFTCLGFAFTVVIPKAGAAVPVGMGLTLTLYFLSGNFFILEDWPRVMDIVANIFPVRHLNMALLTPLNPNTTGAGFEFFHLGIVALWGVAGLVAAVLFFRWTPVSD
jgi:ABC-2 type transport system permease protein